MNTLSAKLKSREELEQIAEKIEYAVFYQNMTASIDILQQLQEETVRCCAGIASKFSQTERLHPDFPNEQLNESAKMAFHSTTQQVSLSILALLPTTAT